MSAEGLEHRKIVVRAGFISILLNLLLTVVKIAIGFFSGSLAILSDAFHGLIDTISGLVVIISEKIKSSQKHADIERIGTRMIAVIILLVSIHITVESIQGLLSPPTINLSIATIIILVISVIAKVTLAIYLRRTAAKVHSTTLKASSVESLNDSLISIATLISTLVYAICQVNIEAYVSLAVAVLIAKSGLDLLRSSKSQPSIAK